MREQPLHCHFHTVVTNLHNNIGLDIADQLAAGHLLPFKVATPADRQHQLPVNARQDSETTGQKGASIGTGRHLCSLHLHVGSMGLPGRNPSNMRFTLRRASCTRASLKPISTHCCTMAGSGSSSARCCARLAAAGSGFVSSVHFFRMCVTMPLPATEVDAMKGFDHTGSTASRIVACTMQQ